MISSDSIGPYLQKARDTQGLSLNQVASLTRIQSKFLQALEDEEFQDLPEQVFTRGFVRTYARSLGLDEEDALRRFTESTNEFYHQGQQAQNQAHLQLQQEQRGKLNRNLVIIVTIAIIVALALLLPRQQQSSPPPSDPAAESSPSEALPTPTSTNRESAPENVVTSDMPNNKPEIAVLETPKLEPESEPEPEQELESEPEAKPKPELKPLPEPVSAQVPVQEPPKPQAPSKPLSTDPIRLEIEATELTWVVVQADNASPLEALLQPSQRGNWEAKQQFTLTLGNAAGVVVRLNGETRGPFGKPGEVVREVVIKP